ncbi:FHA domain-containing protein [Lysinibacter cavernae]|uniref:Putative component of type VI protein secretion system n=1 Tax=Lysinibacter cavernae TaxID=1640652 RepID=A0A7X5R106_9MICO|nr:FHA domain-containing protein [Lysinibacter cavernae]NIH53611.1 putative component of type VI protein secretion system [Lysinibacter cavernae]
MPASAIAVPVDDEDLEETMISASRSGVAPKVVFTLQFSTGQELTVVGHSLLGRNPKTNQGESVENLLVVIDPARSVSKTHLEVNIIDGKLWITDRHSGNGTRVRLHNAPETELTPGQAVEVAARSRVEIGNEFFIVLEGA